MAILFSLCGMLFGMALFAFWVICILDIVKGEFRNSNDKLVWLLLVILVPALGTILYLLIGRKQKIDDQGEFV